MDIHCHSNRFYLQIASHSGLPYTVVHLSSSYHNISHYHHCHIDLRSEWGGWVVCAARVWCEWCVQHVCGVSGVCGVCMHVCDTCSTGNWLQDILGWQVPSAAISRWFRQWSHFVVRSNLRWKEDHSSADSQPLAGEVHAFVWCGVLVCVSICICAHLHDTVCCVLDIDYSIACI